MATIFKIIGVNIGLFVLLMAVFTLGGFLMGYASSNNHEIQLVIFYVLFCLLQFYINWLIFKKLFLQKRKLWVLVALLIVVLYVLYMVLF